MDVGGTMIVTVPLRRGRRLPLDRFRPSRRGIPDRCRPGRRGRRRSSPHLGTHARRSRRWCTHPSVVNTLTSALGDRDGSTLRVLACCPGSRSMVKFTSSFAGRLDHLRHCRRRAGVVVRVAAVDRGDRVRADGQRRRVECRDIAHEPGRPDGRGAALEGHAFRRGRRRQGRRRRPWRSG